MKRRVLIVDDIADIRLMLRCLIEQEGYVIVAEAANGAEAVECYREHLPDITIMDIDMPVKTGVEAAREIRAMEKSARIIFCSGRVRGGERPFFEGGVPLGALVPKPFLPNQLLQAMKM